MPRQRALTKIDFSDIIACLTPVVVLLNELHDSFGTPFVQGISNIIQSLISTAQNAKRNKKDCMSLMEDIYAVIHAIVNLHIQSEPMGSLSPAMLHHVARTLHKIHAFIEAQQDGNKIKHFFRQNEMNTLLRECHTGVQQALEVFKIETGVILWGNIASIQKQTEDMHQQLLEVISNVSDGTTSDSSNSFSMLPGRPKIFHGRDMELHDIVHKLNSEPARIAILGGGGIGKTSLAKAALHNPDITTKFEHRFFVAADSATTSIELAALIGSHLGLKPGQDLTKPVVQYLSRGPLSLLVLDNLETTWEPLQSRAGVEEFLSLLTDVKHLALIITMRGAERPAKTFFEIADDFHNQKDVDRLLHLTNNMPLALDLIAHLVDYEGCSNVLARWETEKTSLLSAGYDKRSSLDASISMSLSSPRMTSCPGAKDLLSLLAILPDGLSDVELLQCNLPIQDLMRCRATLLCTSLAYFDDKRRLKSLVPIREHTYYFYPPSPLLFHPLFQHFHLLLDLYRKYQGVHQNNARINQITSNMGNLNQVLGLELCSDNVYLADAIDCTISLNSFGRTSGHGWMTLMECIPTLFSQPCDHRMEARFITEVLNSWNSHPIVNPQSLVHEAMAHFKHFYDPLLESSFYAAIGTYYQYVENDIAAATEFFAKALSFSKACGDTRQQPIVLCCIAMLKYSIGDYHAAQMHAREAHQIAQLAANSYREAVALGSDALCLMTLGNLKEAVLLSQRARDLLRLCGMQGGNSDHTVMVNLAEVHRQKSEYLEARCIHVEIAQETSPQQDPDNHALALQNIAEVDIMIGADALEVRQNLDNARILFNSLGFIKAVNQCEVMLACLNLREGDILLANESLQQCLNAAWGNDYETMSYCLERLADVDRWTSHNLNWPSTWTVLYLVQAQMTQEKLAVHKGLRFLGDIFLSEGDEHTAHNLFIVAFEGFTSMDVHHGKADCMLRLGDIARCRGNIVRAAELWKGARPLFEQSLQANDVSQIDTRLASLEQDMAMEHLCI
ncbi:hypothetical protein C8R44DRAFT_948811 [Mycena epipterygia]|nr:hypothetical protein C8R44DRAFT_948811 [Mycena epipterygia]